MTARMALHRALLEKIAPVEALEAIADQVEALADTVRQARPGLPDAPQWLDLRRRLAAARASSPGPSGERQREVTAGPSGVEAPSGRRGGASNGLPR